MHFNRTNDSGLSLSPLVFYVTPLRGKVPFLAIITIFTYKVSMDVDDLRLPVVLFTNRPEA